VPVENLKNQEKQSYFNNIIPISILHSEFESITNNALQTNSVSRDFEGNLIRNNLQEAIFNKEQITITSPLRTHKKGLQTTFKIASNNIFNTTQNNINRIEINFNDGQNYRVVPLDENISVNYL